jgi:NAD+ synthetase
LKFALVQTNPTIGDVETNTQTISRRIQEAAAAGADLAIFPEQSLLGYPAKDLLLREEIVRRNVAALENLAQRCVGVAALVGFAEPNDTSSGRPLYNSVALLAEGGVAAKWRKRLLPTYDVFDEARYFEPAGPQSPFEYKGVRLGVTICEDMLSEPMFGRTLYPCDPVADAAGTGADVLINISASPYFLDKQAWRVTHTAAHARRHRLPIVFVNQVGGNDELLFDGASCALDETGNCIAQASSFIEETCLIEVSNKRPLTVRSVSIPSPTPTGMAGLYAGLVMGIRDYARKCGFKHVVIGLSGGIDSAVVAALAAAAVGPDNIHGVAMPSRYSSEHSIADARTLAENLRIKFSIISIEPVHAAYEAVLGPHFDDRPPNVTEENVQARIRGGILMALSNKFGSLLLTTGNKSELAIGYCTLYGDMCGGLAVISDVPKTMVYSLGKYINDAAKRAIIPQHTFTKPPSAELRPNQTDQDTLPTYDVLDAVVERYEEQLHSPEQLVAAGTDSRVVSQVLRMMRLSEYKRQQAAPGLKVTSRAFGFGRRMPIAARY